MNTTRISMCVVGGLALLAFAGCDSGSRKQAVAANLNLPPEPTTTSKYTLEEAAKLRSQNPAASTAVDKNNGTTNGGEKIDDTIPPLADPNAPPPPDGNNPAPPAGIPPTDSNAGRVKAEPGVGAAGRDLGGGYLGVTFGAYFGAKEKIAFDQMEYALKLFKALNGGPPKSQAEFMDKIIKENGIKLPELPAGKVYEYDPKTGVLNVGTAADNK